MADELPSVMLKLFARCSRSSTSSCGRPYRIKSRFSSPITLTSNVATLRFPVPAKAGLIQHHNAIQILRRVWIQSLTRSRKKTHQLSRHDMGRQQCQFVHTEIHLDGQVAGALHIVGGTVT